MQEHPHLPDDYILEGNRKGSARPPSQLFQGQATSILRNSLVGYPAQEREYLDYSGGRAQAFSNPNHGDQETVARVAHDSNGSSGNLGIWRMRQLYVELQALGQAKDLTKAGALLAQLVSKFERVSQRLLAEQATIPRTPRTDDA